MTPSLYVITLTRVLAQRRQQLIEDEPAVIVAAFAELVPVVDR